MNFAEFRFWFYLACILGLVLGLRPIVVRGTGGSEASIARYDRTAILIVGLFLLGCVKKYDSIARSGFLS